MVDSSWILGAISDSLIPMSKGSSSPGQRRRQSWTTGGKGGLALFRRSAALRDVATLAAVFALLIQICLPWAHQPAVAMRTGAPGYVRTPAILSAQLALCQAAAQKPSGIPAKGPAHELSPCPMCLALELLGNLLPPTDGVVVECLRPVIPHDMTGRAPLVARAFNPTSQPRAPPITA
jgi:hypothetical protein